MFTIKKLLHLLEKENHSWKNPTAMTKTILMVLTDYHYPSESFFWCQPRSKHLQ